ncbi:MAG: FHA domain-containing protein, partial [Gemmatimonadota bacterium]|nr:FHA domain-containing protein [Gemmatimonadota bacterium]
PAPRPAPPPLSKEPPTLPPEAPAPPAPPAHPPLVAAPEPVAVPVPAAALSAMAELEIVKEGPDKGRRIEIRDALTHIGRGEHNEVSFADDSVSDTHAKLQLRDDGWYVVDLGSTNGTFVGGVRISGERRLEGTPDLRFGGVRVRFHALAEPALAASGTRRVSFGGVERELAPTPRGRVPVWVWIAGAAVVALILYFILQRT